MKYLGKVVLQRSILVVILLILLLLSSWANAGAQIGNPGNVQDGSGDLVGGPGFENYNPETFDSDRDGVFDKFDECPFVFGRGPNGCPLPTSTPAPRDDDNDGIPNSSDGCPREYGTDGRGCPVKPTPKPQPYIPPVNPDTFNPPPIQAQPQVQSIPSPGCVCSSMFKPGVTRACGEAPHPGDCSVCTVSGQWIRRFPNGGPGCPIWKRWR